MYRAHCITANKAMNVNMVFSATSLSLADYLFAILCYLIPSLCVESYIKIEIKELLGRVKSGKRRIETSIPACHASV